MCLSVNICRCCALTIDSAIYLYYKIPWCVSNCLKHFFCSTKLYEQTPRRSLLTFPELKSSCTSFIKAELSDKSSFVPLTLLCWKHTGFFLCFFFKSVDQYNWPTLAFCQSICISIYYSRLTKMKTLMKKWEKNPSAMLWVALCSFPADNTPVLNTTDSTLAA